MAYCIIFYIFLISSVVLAASFSFSPTNYIHIHKSSSCNIIQRYDTSVNASIKQRLTFNSPPLQNGKDAPKLILISGCPGTGEYVYIIIVDKRYARNTCFFFAHTILHWVDIDREERSAYYQYIYRILLNVSQRYVCIKLFTHHLFLTLAYLSTGKSTFGMSLALEQGILKCISTDTVRAVMRSYVPESISPPLHRSSYASSVDDGTDNAVKSWKGKYTFTYI